ncbi:MAG: hypothetical protein II440_00380, partial [Clostridia bacterium]|nr:hypothetical protein [Clostridia bacterium]
MSKQNKNNGNTVKRKSKIAKEAQYAIIVAVCLLLEIIIANYPAMRLKLGGFKEKEIDISAF